MYSGSKYLMSKRYFSMDTANKITSDTKSRDQNRSSYLRYLGILLCLLQFGVAVDCRSSDNVGKDLFQSLLEIDGVTSDAVEVLLQGGALVDSADLENFTALHRAAAGGRADIVTLLIRYKANIEAKNIFGDTPLSLAVRYGHTDVVKILLQAGASVNSVDNDNTTPLHRAASEGHALIVELLLKAGALVNSIDNYNQTPLQYATLGGHNDIVTLLKQHNPVEI